MNPQQFQNMGGMGRGMQANNMQQMNPAFQMNAQMVGQMAGQMGGQMGAQMGGQMGMPMQAQMGNQMNVTHPQMQKHIFQSLQSQGQLSGWQASVTIQERAAQVKQLVDSLRLVRPPVELPRAVEVALQFERKCFTQSTSKEAYFHECSEKLGRIRDQRAQQLNQAAAGGMQGMQQGMNMGTPNPNFQQIQQMGQNGGQTMGQNMMQTMNQNMGQNMGQNLGIPPHMQQQMQASPMFNQQRMPQNMMNQTQMMQNQALMQNQNNNQQKQNQAPELTPEDNKAINLRAAELAKSTPKEEMRNIVEKMNPQLRQNLMQKQVDPIIYYFRMLATKEFRRRKMMEAGGNINQVGNNGNMMGQMPNQPAQNNATQAGNQNTPFLNDMGRFQGLQAEGLRSQEGGELVVPASNPQGMTPDHLRLQQQMLANSQRANQGNQPGNMDPTFLAQQQRIQQAQANKLQQAAQFQAQSQQQAQARAQAAAQAAAQVGMGQQGQIQNIPQSSTPLSMLNRPAGQNFQGSSPQNLSRPASRAPMPGQQPQLGQNNVQQPQLSMTELQNRDRYLSGFPPHIQNLLRTKPQNQWPALIQELGQQNAMRRSVSQQPGGLQQPQPQQPQQTQQGLQMQNGAFLGGANIGPSPMQQSLSAGAIGGQANNEMNSMMPGMPQQGQMQPSQELLRQRQAQIQQQQQQQQAQRMQTDQSAGPNAQNQPPRPLNPAELKVMDQQAVPPNILNSIRQHTRIPDIKTWIQLKQWVMTNPIPNLTMPNLMSIQANHFAHMMKARRAATQNMAQGSAPGQLQPPSQPQQPQQPQQPPTQQPQQPQQPSQQQVPQQRVQQPAAQPQVPNAQSQNAAFQPGQTQMKPPTLQDIQKIRAANPKLQNMSDEQVRNLLMSRQRQLMQQQAMQQAAIQQQTGQQPQNQQMPFMPATQTNQQMPPQQVSNQQPQQPPRQPQAPAQTQPQPQAQARPAQAEKNAKRPNEEEITEVANPAQPVSKPFTAEPGKGIQQLTKEQFNALDPVKKQQYMKYQRQQLALKKIIELTKEVQTSMNKLRPLNLDNASRKKIMALLTTDNVKNMLGRFDQFLLAYYQMEQNDGEVKKLIQHRLQLFPQYKPETIQNKTFVPVENPSITLEAVETIINNITTKFQQTAAQIPKAQPAQLTPENLSRLEAQEQERKKSIKGSNVPPAPTTTQPPFQFGDSRGQGTPRYATPGLKQEDLKLPTDPKRRKKNPPTPVTTSAPSAAMTTSSPQPAKAPHQPVATFKCAVDNCEFHVKGFSTQAELDQHTSTAHELIMKPVTDPIAFLDSSLRSAFNLDENLKQIRKLPVGSQVMEKAPSKAGTVTNLKFESKPATPVPMAKIPSQVEATSSPATAKANPQNADKQQNGNLGSEQEEDFWKYSNVTVEDLRLGFGDIDWTDIVPTSADKLEEDFLKTYQQSEEWQKIIRGPDGNLTDTPTDKSNSPPVANEKDSDSKGKSVAPKDPDDFTIDLQNIEGLNLTPQDIDIIDSFDFDSNLFDPSAAANINVDAMDVAVTDDTDGSPFEIIEKPKLTQEQEFLLSRGIDYTRPDSLTASQKRMAEFWLTPMAGEEPAEPSDTDVFGRPKKVYEANMAWNGFGWDAEPDPY